MLSLLLGRVCRWTAAGAKEKLTGLSCRWVLYADDLSLIAPSRAILARMLEIVEEYGASLNLHFSTCQDPGKCKSFCIYFQKSGLSLSSHAQRRHLALEGKCCSPGPHPAAGPEI